MFWKTLIAFNFDESVAQVTMQHHVSKDFLPLHFAVGQVLSISGYDLETKHGVKNPDFHFVPLLLTLLA